jgi:hypothetical protein
LFIQSDKSEQKIGFYGIMRYMAKQRMIVTDDQLLIDMDLLFNAIREANGDWQQVERDMQQYLAAVQGMADASQEDASDEE